MSYCISQHKLVYKMGKLTFHDVNRYYFDLYPLHNSISAMKTKNFEIATSPVNQKT